MSAAAEKDGLNKETVPEKDGLHKETVPEKEPIKKDQDGTEEEDEDEDIDALIEELESQDGNIEEEEEGVQPGAARNVPEELLQTDTRHGLSNQEVLNRRKKYGLNQMREEKENLILKFLGFFIGPIQFVMEVCLGGGGHVGWRTHPSVNMTQAHPCLYPPC
jgi:H+-transporting ATPase